MVGMLNFFVSMSSIVLFILQMASHSFAHACYLTTVISEPGLLDWTFRFFTPRKLPVPLCRNFEFPSAIRSLPVKS